MSIFLIWIQLCILIFAILTIYHQKNPEKVSELTMAQESTRTAVLSILSAIPVTIGMLFISLLVSEVIQPVYELFSLV